MKNYINLTTHSEVTVSLPISKIQRIGSNQHGGIVDIGRSFDYEVEQRPPEILRRIAEALKTQEDKVLDILTNVEISP